MKRVISDDNSKTIKFSEINDEVDGVVAFKTDGQVFILVGLVDQRLTWAFHPLFHVSAPMYQSNILINVLTQATTNHKVFFFETQGEFLEWAPYAKSKTLGDNDD